MRAALTYAARGWAIFPLGMRSKKPITDKGVLDATTDEAQIRAWWKQYPSANIGIATGASGLAVLDVDKKKADHERDGMESLLEWVATHGADIPATVTAYTPTGGVHLLFRYDGNELGPAQDVFGKGSNVDLRAANSYIVAPPSIHPDTGTAYKWDKNAHPARVELANLPDALLRNLTTAKPTGNGIDRSSEAPEIIEDGQDAYGARQAAVLARKGFGKEEARAALEAMIETRFAGGWTGLDARRPWKAGDVERWLKGAYEKFYDPDAGDSQTEEQEAIAGLGFTEPGTFTGSVNKAETGNKPKQKLDGITADELQTQEYKPLRWVISDLLPEGASILGGKPKVGKSWLTLGLASAVAGGEYALGELPVTKGEVVYLALEDGRRRLQRRLKKMLGDKPWPKGLTFFTEWPRVDQGGIEELDKWLAEHPKAQLVVIDTLKHIRAPESARIQGYGADYEAVTPLQQLATKHGVAVLIVTHLRKLDADDPLDTVQGTLGISGGLDGTYVFKRPKGSLKGTLYYRGRDIEEGEKELIWKEGESMLWRLSDGNDELPKPGDVVLDAIKPGTTVTPQQLADTLGLPADTVRKRLERLTEYRQVVRVRKGHYALPETPLDTF